jgi:hypothetical protein
MGKAGDMGRAWVSGLKLKQWLRWIGGDSPLPDVRSRKIMGATAGVGVILVALASFTLGGGGKPNTGVKTNTPGVLYSPPVAPRTAPQSGFVPATTTTAATPTTIGTATGTSKRAHSHIRHTGTRRARTRGIG